MYFRHDSKNKERIRPKTELAFCAVICGHRRIFRMSHVKYDLEKVGLQRNDFSAVHWGRTVKSGRPLLPKGEFCLEFLVENLASCYQAAEKHLRRKFQIRENRISRASSHSELVPEFLYTSIFRSKRKKRKLEPVRSRCKTASFAQYDQHFSEHLTPNGEREHTSCRSFLLD